MPTSVDTDPDIDTDTSADLGDRCGAGAGAGSSDSSSDVVLAQVRTAVEVMGGCDLSRCGHEQLDRLSHAAQRVRGFVTSFDARLARRRQELWEGAEVPTAGSGTGGSSGDTPDADPDDTSGDADGDDTSGDAGSGGCGDDPTLVLAGLGEPSGGHRTDAERERDHTRARTLVLFPTFEEPLTTGVVDGGHIDALSAALARFNTADPVERDAHTEFVAHHEMLLRYAVSENPKRFRQRCQDLSLRLARAAGLQLVERQRREAEVRTWIDQRTGMGHLHAKIEPDLFEAVVGALDNHLADVRASSPNAGESLERMRVDALASLVCHSGALQTHHPEVIVLIDLDTLRSGTLAANSTCETIDGTALHPETVRRHACDGHIIPAVLGGAGEPLDVGRRQRTATASQRRALATMYRTCGHPGCEVPVRRCRIHHIVWWRNGGRTDLAALIPLCEFHHHQVHEGRWGLSMTPDRIITLTTPDGTHYYTGDTTDRSCRVRARQGSAAASTARSGADAAEFGGSEMSGGAETSREPEATRQGSAPPHDRHESPLSATDDDEQHGRGGSHVDPACDRRGRGGSDVDPARDRRGRSSSDPDPARDRRSRAETLFDEPERPPRSSSARWSRSEGSPRSTHTKRSKPSEHPTRSARSSTTRLPGDAAAARPPTSHHSRSSERPTARTGSTDPADPADHVDPASRTDSANPVDLVDGGDGRHESHARPEGAGSDGASGDHARPDVVRPDVVRPDGVRRDGHAA